ncbi:MAG: 50S ribosomal protein L9 [Rhodospirillaceae bacterium]|nr:50S ribosomal protein L9 [Rhodospirillaceae bacterium]OUT78297.1 MAG: 50S ribosomal protein L9 [Rhodospirillaceae bacterium TMED23]|tara:strand:- start:75 stop:713 length:639 start_codon:yes stop_codon:yes gene_type:complete
MELILLERIEKLGQMGALVNVKPGYARNFLLPQKKAVTATEENKAHYESHRSNLEAQNLKLRTEAEKIGDKLRDEKYIVIRQAGDAGQLYGSVSARDVAESITETGISVNRNQIKLESPIKTIGLHTIKLSLHPEVTITVTVNVARSIDEAKIQDKTGAIIISNEEQSSLKRPQAQFNTNDENNELDVISVEQKNDLKLDQIPSNAEKETDK